MALRHFWVPSLKQKRKRKIKPTKVIREKKKRSNSCPLENIPWLPRIIGRVDPPKIISLLNKISGLNIINIKKLRESTQFGPH